MAKIQVDPDQDFHVVIRGEAVALSLDALAAAHEGGLVSETSLIWQPGFPEWLPLERVLAEMEDSSEEEAPASVAAPIGSQSYGAAAASAYLAPAPVPSYPAAQPAAPAPSAYAAPAPAAYVAPAPSTYAAPQPAAVSLPQPSAPPRSVAPPAELYSVALSQDEVKQMTLAQIKDSVRLGVIELDALVWQQGMSDWQPISTVLAQSPMSQPAPAPQSIPAARSVAPAPQSFAPAPQSLAPAAAAPVSARPASLAAGPGFVGAAQALAPVSLAPVSLAPMSNSVPPASLVATSLSVRPGALDDDDDLLMMQKKRKFGWAGKGMIAAAALVGALVLHRNGASAGVAEAAGQPQTDKSTPAGMKNWLASVDQQNGLNKIGSPVEKSGSSSASSASSSSGSSLSLDALKKIEEKPASEPEKTAASFGDLLSGKKAAPTAKATTGRSRVAAPSKKGSKAKKSGGHHDAYDPMNGTL